MTTRELHPLHLPLPGGPESIARRLTFPVSIGVSLLALVVYLLVMGDTTPFWDAGEFIATSWILGIPHPPGTPLYVLLGRVACLFPVGTVAERVNGLSAVAGAVAVLFTVLATVRLARPMWGSSAGDMSALLAGVVAGLFVGFSNTFWVNAIEAEVYALSSMVMAIAVWATLRWRDAAEVDESGGDGRVLVLVFYLLSLSIGIHLGTYLVLPGLLVLVALERRHGFLLRPQVLLGLFLLFALGVSVHLFLFIRSHLDPAINEAAPKNWDALWDVLTRKQYPPSNILERRGPFFFQVDRLYLHYLREQFVLSSQMGVLGRVVPLALGILGACVHFVRRRRDGSMMLTHFLIMSLGLIVYLNLSGTFNEGTGRWEIGEVRERDYFFVGSFQIFAMWIGIGAAALVADAARVSGGGVKRSRTLALGAIAAVGIALLPLGAGLEAHDRRGNYVARDYGYNILAFLEPNAILFTNGDNDTFPLWYLQEVEGIRKDVRVVCLSLLNTSWYIKQLRDDPPQVPIAWTDAEIDSLRVAYHPRDGLVTLHADGTYEPGTIKDAGVRHIVRVNAFERPLYFAVTVPDRIGFDRQLSFEGMVFRVTPEPASASLDFDRAYVNAFKNYKYRGILLPDGSRDRSVHIDETGEYLIHNYVIHFAELAFELERRERYEEALHLLARSRAIAPGRSDIDLLSGVLLDDMGRSTAAESVFREVLANNPNDLDARYRLGVSLVRQRRLAEAQEPLAEAIRLSKGEYLEPTLWLARVEWDQGNPPAARRLLADWLETHPGDGRAARVLEGLSRGQDASLPR